MKKNAINSAIKMLGMSFIAVTAMFTPVFCQVPAPDFDMNTYSLAVSSSQKAKFRLPKDIRSGDMITGTVVEAIKANAAGNNNASSRLEGVVIEIEGKQTKLSDRLISFIVPAGVATIPFLLKSAAGEVIDHGQIAVGGPMYDLLSDLWWREPLGGLYSHAPVGQPGQSLTISGPFDGNAANTRLSLSGQICEVMVENPRTCIVNLPQTATAGVSNLTIEEGTNKEVHKFNVAVLNLTADKTSLLSGEKAKIKVSVSGLAGLSNTNLKLALENQSPQTVAFTKEPGTIINKDFNTNKAKNGVYEFSTKIIALTKGSYTVVGTLTQPGDGGNPCVKEYNECNKAAEDEYEANAKKCNESANGNTAVAAACLAPLEKKRDAQKAECVKRFIECSKKK